MTVKLADLVVLSFVAEIVTEVEELTEAVATVKVALVAPAGTVTLAGTVATAVLLLERETIDPLPGAAPVRVTVPWEEFPPVTVVGFKAREAKPTAGGGGSTVKPADLLVLPRVAEMVTALVDETDMVVTVNVALVAPAGTVTLPGTVATAVLLLERVTVAPPPGAALVRVTVP